MKWVPRVPRRIVSRVPIIGTEFASDDEVLKEFDAWDAEDAEEKRQLEEEISVTRSLRGKGRRISIKFPGD